MGDASTVSPDPGPESTLDTAAPTRNWPLNSWWVAAHGSEVTRKPVLRWLLEMPMVLYRTIDGAVVALHNRCPHRGAPLSMGGLEGDELVCMYHGMRYAPSGQCTHVPTQRGAASAIRVRAFPAVERYGFVWVWTGEPQSAHPDLIPADLAYLSDGNWHSVWGYRSVNANYMQLQENVLDITHVPFLHKNSAGVNDLHQMPIIEVTNNRVTFRQKFERAPLPAVNAIPAGKPVGKLVNRENCGTMLTPGVHHGAIDVVDPEPEPEGLVRFSLRVVHLTTPVSRGKSHYYWALARDHGEPYDVETTRAGVNLIFDEDILVVEASQAMAQRSCEDEKLLEYSVKADRAAIEARRIVAALVNRERHLG